MKALAGTGTMIRLILRRDRIIIPIFVLAFALLVTSQAAGSQSLYENQQERDLYARTAENNPALVAITGPPFAIDTVGGDTAWQIGGFGAAAVGLVSVILVGRHTRTEEQSGRGELLRASVLGRYAQPTAALIVVSGANVLLGAVTAAGLMGFGLDATGAISFGSSMGAVGILFAALGTLIVQVTENPSTVYGIGGSVLGIAYALRAVGDVGEGNLPWLSPIGWAQRMRPFADERWWPLLLFAAASVVCVFAAYVLMSRRDIGAGLLDARPGRAAASSLLTSPLGLAFRLQRGLLIGWSFGMFAGGLTVGSIAKDAGDLVGDGQMAQNLVGQVSGQALIDNYFALVLLIMAMIASAYAVQSALRMRSEEDSGRLEPILATAVSRWRWISSNLVLTLGGASIVVAASGFGAGISHALRTGDVSEVWSILGAQLASLPAVWVVAGIAVLLFGVVPRLGYLAWAALGAFFLVGVVGPLLQLPDRVMDVSPYTHVPQVPAEDLAVEPLVWLVAVAVALLAVGTVAFRRRDLK